jgi:hypothetical protein
MAIPVADSAGSRCGTWARQRPQQALADPQTGHEPWERARDTWRALAPMTPVLPTRSQWRPGAASCSPFAGVGHRVRHAPRGELLVRVWHRRRPVSRASWGARLGGVYGSEAAGPTGTRRQLQGARLGILRVHGGCKVERNAGPTRVFPLVRPALVAWLPRLDSNQ